MEVLIREVSLITDMARTSLAEEPETSIHVLEKKAQDVNMKVM